MRPEHVDALIDAMADGARVVAVLADMDDASDALHAVCSRCGERGIEHRAWRSNARMRVESDGGHLLRVRGEQPARILVRRVFGAVTFLLVFKPPFCRVLMRG